jgi:hypothetical protein
MRSSTALALAPLLLAAACSSAPAATTGGAGGTGATGTSSAGGAGGAGGAATETCTATFRWLQKDAYKDTAGRSSALWPPHTTTTLDVTCQKPGGAVEMVGSGVMVNHGTAPDAKDAHGDVILVETKKAETTGARADLLNLLSTYEGCKCDPKTQFLSMDSLQDAAVQDLVQNVMAYLQMHLVCTSEGGTAALVQSLADGDIPTVIDDLSTCTWDTGSDLASGLDDALGTFLATTQEVLADYHVCNNDAALQAGLWDWFAQNQTVVVCNGDAPACHGPKWFYEP